MNEVSLPMALQLTNEDHPSIFEDTDEDEDFEKI